jgi:hypothetical protein
MVLKHFDWLSDYSKSEAFFQHGGRKSFLFLLIDFEEILKYGILQNK